MQGRALLAIESSLPPAAGRRTRTVPCAYLGTGRRDRDGGMTLPSSGNMPGSSGCNLPGTSPAIFALVVATLRSITQSRDYGMGNPGPGPKRQTLCNWEKDDLRWQSHHTVTLTPVSASPYGDTDPGPCIWQAPRVLFSSQSRLSQRAVCPA